MRYLSLSEILDLHNRIIACSGGATGVRDLAALESAAAQPHGQFEGKDLYPGPVEKAAALAFSLIMNHPFVDGNKRVGHAAAETFLLLNGYEIDADIAEQERIILALAAGDVSREDYYLWLNKHTRSIR